VVVQDPGRPVLLGDPDFWVGGDVAHELHDADPDGHAGGREDRVGLRTNRTEIIRNRNREYSAITIEITAGLRSR
jgi:hypothetical protein